MEMIVWGPETELVHTRLDKYHKNPAQSAAATPQTPAHKWVGSTPLEFSDFSFFRDDKFYMEFQWFP